MFSLRGWNRSYFDMDNGLVKYNRIVISVYTSAFNVTKMQYDWQDAFNNFLAIGDELVIAVNKSEDNTEEVISTWAATMVTHAPRIVYTDFSYDDPDLDGKIKNEALQATTGQYKVGLDLDERIPDKFKYHLRNLCSNFYYDKTDVIMLPVINLYKDREHFKNIAQKFYFHRGGLRRGTINAAKHKYGNTHDIEKSDSCEILDSEGNLPRLAYLIPPQASDYEKMTLIKQQNIPFVIHEGLLDLEKKALRNELFWKNHWAIESGDEVNVPTTAIGIQEHEGVVEGYAHGLKL